LSKTVRVVGPTGANGTLEQVYVLSQFAGPTGLFPVWVQAATGATGFKNVIGAARLAIDSGFTVLDQTDVIPGVLFGGVTAYKIQGTAAAISATLTRPVPQSATKNCASAIVSFKSAAAWKLVSHVGGGGAFAPGGTDAPSLDTTTADLIVVVMTGGSFVTPVDSNGNTWTLAKHQSSGGNAGEVSIWYCLNPTVGAGHTFTLTPSFNTHAISAWSGSAPGGFDQQNGTSLIPSDGVTLTQSTGSITPTADNELLIAAFGLNDPSNNLTGPTGPNSEIKTVIISGYSGPR
jgi:hypothetical protein